MSGLLTLLALSACTTPDSPTEAILQEEARAFTEEAVAQWTVAEDGTLRAPASAADDLEVGQVLVGGSAEVPLLHHLVDLREEGDELVLEVEPATLVDAFAELHVDLDTADTSARTALYSRGGEVVEAVAWEQPLTVVLTADDTATLEVDGLLSYEAELAAAIDIERGELQSASLALTGTVGLSLEESFTLQAADTWKVEEALVEDLRIGRVWVPLGGGIPLWIDVVGEVDVGAELSVEAEVLVEAGQAAEASITGGVAWEDGQWSPITDASLSWTHTGPELSAYGAMSVRTWVEPTLGFELYGIAGPHLAVQGYTRLQGEVHSSGGADTASMSLAAGLTGKAGGRFDVLGHEAEVELDLFSLEEELWSEEVELGPPVETLPVLFTRSGLIYTLDPDTGEEELLCDPGHNLAALQWSPSQAKIAGRVRTDAGHDEVFVMDGDCSNYQQLTDNQDPYGVSTPRFLDEHTLWFARAYATGRTEIFEMSTSGGSQTELSDLYPTGHSIGPFDMDDQGLCYYKQQSSWSPSGRVYCNDLAYGSEVQVSSMWASGPVLSPDGAQVAYFGTLDESTYSIYVADRDGSGEQAIATCANSVCRDPVWSPDGAWVAFRIGGGGSQYDLWAVNPTTKEVLQLSDTSDVSEGIWDWR